VLLLLKFAVQRQRIIEIPDTEKQKPQQSKMAIQVPISLDDLISFNTTSAVNHSTDVDGPDKFADNETRPYSHSLSTQNDYNNFERLSPPPTASLAQHAIDDIWAHRGRGPSSQVDYLSHQWSEQEVWSSWQYLRAHKRLHSTPAFRLENGIWRAWAKFKYNLETIPPVKLNWYDTDWAD
jgi:hypothetical protein